jgi:hypothetical protein
VNTAMNLRVPYKVSDLLVIWATISFSRRSLLHRVSLVTYTRICVEGLLARLPPGRYSWKPNTVLKPKLEAKSWDCIERTVLKTLITDCGCISCAEVTCSGLGSARVSMKTAERHVSGSERAWPATAKQGRGQNNDAIYRRISETEWRCIETKIRSPAFGKTNHEVRYSETEKDVIGLFKWDSWWTKWHWIRFFSEFFGFLLLIIIHHCSIIIFHRPTRCVIALTKQHIIIPSVLSYGPHLWPALGWSRRKGKIF